MAERLALSSGFDIACIGILNTASRTLVDIWVGHGSSKSGLSEAEAIEVVSRALMTSFSLSQSGPAAGCEAMPLAAEEAEPGHTWLRSGRYLIGIGERIGNVAAMVAFVGRDGTGPLSGEQKSMAQIGLTYADQLLHEQFGGSEETEQNHIPDIILRSLSFGFAVANAQGTLGYMTDSARTWLRETDALHVVNGRLAARGFNDQQLLQSALARAAKGAGRSSVLQLDPESETPRAIVILPIKESPSLALVVFGQGQGDNTLREQLLETLGLTVAERRLAQHLLAGKSLADAAAESNLTIGTARSYLKRIFAKTGIHRQSQLITLCHTLMPPLKASILPGQEPQKRQIQSGSRP